MEFDCQKRNRRRKKRKHNNRKKRVGFNVTFDKHLQRLANFRLVNRGQSIVDMEASAFWQNYNVAQDWQKSHSVIWWRTRCNALEHENKLLKDKIRNLLSTNHPPKQYPRTSNCQSTSSCPQTIFETPQAPLNYEPVRNSEETEKDNEDDLVFQMNDDMMKFLEQSMRHKRELKKMREESKKDEDMIECGDSKVECDSARDWVQNRIKFAKLLYGEACSRILAMETALQATNERHVDKAKPQFWPNIPLNIKFN